MGFDGAVNGLIGQDSLARDTDEDQTASNNITTEEAREKFDS